MQSTTTSAPLSTSSKSEFGQSVVAGLKKFQMAIAHFLSSRSELQVQQFVNGSDAWWYAYDPQAGNWVYADSEAELRIWIEQNY